jgi:hypothetical protein
VGEKNGNAAEIHVWLIKKLFYSKTNMQTCGGAVG